MWAFYFLLPHPTNSRIVRSLSMSHFVHSVTCNPFAVHRLPPFVTQDHGSDRANV
jgi:hypothetical protein